MTHVLGEVVVGGTLAGVGGMAGGNGEGHVLVAVVVADHSGSGDLSEDL